MKLYQAMLAGCQLSKQETDGHGTTGKNRCALGAALAIISPSNQEEIHGYDIISSAYPFTSQRTMCPVLSCGNMWEVRSLIWHLNDQHKWKREDIAYWLRDNFEIEETVLETKPSTIKETANA